MSKHVNSSQMYEDFSNLVGVYVKDNNIERALKILKNESERSGLLSEFKKRQYYEKPSETKYRKIQSLKRKKKRS